MAIIISLMESLYLLSAVTLALRSAWVGSREPIDRMINWFVAIMAVLALAHHVAQWFTLTD